VSFVEAIVGMVSARRAERSTTRLAALESFSEEFDLFARPSTEAPRRLDDTEPSRARHAHGKARSGA